MTKYMVQLGGIKEMHDTYNEAERALNYLYMTYGTFGRIVKIEEKEEEEG